MDLSGQEIFNIAVVRLRRSVRGELPDGQKMVCKYWDRKTGYRCSIGQFIQDNSYDAEWDVKDTPVNEAILKACSISDNEIFLMQSLQALHDRFVDYVSPEVLEILEQEIKLVAKQFELTIPPL